MGLVFMDDKGEEVIECEFCEDVIPLDSMQLVILDKLEYCLCPTCYLKEFRYDIPCKSI